MENKFHFDIIEKTIGFVKDRNLKQLTAEEIANYVNLSQFDFQRVFKEWVGISPKEYLQFITLETAKKSLQKGQSTLKSSNNVVLSGNSRQHNSFVKIESYTSDKFPKRGEGLNIYYGEIETPFGNAIIVETPKGICSVSFDNQAIENLKTEYNRALFINQLAKNGKLLQKYFGNWKVPANPINLDLIGTPFQIQVWKALLQIPSSELLAYQDIAKMINNPKAVRAVGTAIGKNPIAYLIPCHRVVKSDGKMGNYRWNPERKIAINSYESIKLK